VSDTWLTSIGEWDKISLVTYDLADAKNIKVTWRTKAENEAEKQRWLDAAHPMPKAKKGKR
jgi:hypothetical protein